jgi:hypothetical protein
MRPGLRRRKIDLGHIYVQFVETIQDQGKNWIAGSNCKLMMKGKVCIRVCVGAI